MDRSIAVVTTFGGRKRYRLVSRRMLSTLDRWWIPEVEVLALVENPAQFRSNTTRTEFVDIDRACFQLVEFRGLCQDLHRGKSGKGNYNYREDAYSFSHKVFTIAHAVERYQDERDVLIWIDDDVITFEHVDETFLESVCPGLDQDVAFLPRIGMHSETGFIAINLKSERAVQFFLDFAELYRSGKVFELEEWHDAYVFDWLREHQSKPLRVRNLSPDFATSHPFINGVLGSRMDHLKGFKRRVLGKSYRTDLVEPRREGYWQRFPNDRWYELRRYLRSVWFYKVTKPLGLRNGVRRDQTMEGF